MADDLSDDEQRIEQRRASTTREQLLRAELVQVRDELRALLEQLDRLGVQPEPAQSAVVTAVVPKTILLHIGSVRR